MSGTNRASYEKAIERILADVRYWLLLQRVSPQDPSSHPLLSIHVLSKVVRNSVALLLDNDVEALVFQATPHEPYSWVVASVAEVLEIPVFMLQTSPLPWRYWVVRGLAQQEWVDVEYGVGSDEATSELQVVDEFVRLVSGTYAEALPPYEARRLAARRGQLWSWLHEIKSAASAPGRLRHLRERWTLYRACVGSCISDLATASPYVALMLHYQPERTSMPEGGMFAQQWLMIESLVSALPPEWSLRVKEHPSTITGRFKSGYRSKAFYEDLTCHPRVHSVDPRSDTFELIDGAGAVATITGTVGVQALVRGKPVITFGVASYRGAPGVYAVETFTDVPSAVNAALTASGVTPEVAAVREYLLACVPASTGPGELGGAAGIGRLYSASNRASGHGRLLPKLLTYLADREGT